MRRPRYLATGAPAAVGAAVIFGAALSVVALTSCGPIEYMNQVGLRAASAVADAKKAGADRYAPYEYTAAEEYLHKAREEGGYAQYQDSIEYGRKAEELAGRAKAIAVTRMSQPTTPGKTPEKTSDKTSDEASEKPSDKASEKLPEPE